MTSASSASDQSPSLISLLSMVVLGLALFAYVGVAIYSQDPAWFLPTFNAAPRQAVILCYGRQVTINSGDPHLEALSARINQQLSSEKRWDEIALTEQTLKDYLTDPKMMILQLFYAEPVRVHLPSPLFSDLNTLLIPLDGRHADKQTIFGLADGKATGGSLHVKSTQILREYIEQAGLCAKP